MTNDRVTRADLETKLREIKGEVDSTATAAKPVGLAVGVAVALAAAGLVYLLGRRSAKKKTTVVEVRRV